PDLLAAVDPVADLQALDDRVEVHVRGERAVVVLDADIAAAPAVASQLRALDPNDDAIADGDDRAADRAREIDAAVAGAALIAHHADAPCAEPRGRAVGHLLVGTGDRIDPVEQRRIQLVERGALLLGYRELLAHVGHRRRRFPARRVRLDDGHEVL